MWRKFVLAVLVALGLSAPLVAQSATVLTSADALGFDYLDADYSTFQVTSFEASWDGGAFATLSASALKLADTPAGYTTYKVIPPFTSGTHQVIFRACNASGCGGGSSPFAFAFLASPNAPTHVRKIPR